MTSSTDPENQRPSSVESFHSHWLMFVLVGGLFILAGGLAILIPPFSSIAPNEVLGAVLMIVGLAQIVLSAKMQRDSLFAWCLALGCTAAVGGVLVYLEPFSDVVTKMRVMALVFGLHGLTQIAFASSVRTLKGWGWFVLAGAAALLAGSLLVMKLPYNPSFTPATVGGVSLVCTGWAYLVVTLALRRS